MSRALFHSMNENVVTGYLLDLVIDGQAFAFSTFAKLRDAADNTVVRLRDSAFLEQDFTIAEVNATTPVETFANGNDAYYGKLYDQSTVAVDAVQTSANAVFNLKAALSGTQQKTAIGGFPAIYGTGTAEKLAFTKTMAGVFSLAFVVEGFKQYLTRFGSSNYILIKYATEIVVRVSGVNYSFTVASNTALRTIQIIRESNNLVSCYVNGVFQSSNSIAGDIQFNEILKQSAIEANNRTTTFVGWSHDHTANKDVIHSTLKSLHNNLIV